MKLIGTIRIFLHNFPCQLLLNAGGNNIKNFFRSVTVRFFYNVFRKLTEYKPLNGQTSECKAGKKGSVTMNSVFIRAWLFDICQSVR